MNKNIAIGVDIGGSHITSAAVDLDKLEIVKGSFFSKKVDNKASKNLIFTSWANAINKTIDNMSLNAPIRIGFAMPGPFQYKTGIAMFKGNDKYENLYNVSVIDKLPHFLDGKNHQLRFLNDATAFGVGVAKMGNAKNSHKVIAITLGTGFGSSFIKSGIPIVTASDVPEGGCLWDKPFKDDIADAYFSTRWFIKKYKELSGKEVKGVKEIAEGTDEFSEKTFKAFAQNFSEFMMPVIKLFQPDLIVLGGNISNAHQRFLPEVHRILQEHQLDVNFSISELMEDAAIIGSARLFEPEFWNKVKNELPNS